MEAEVEDLFPPCSPPPVTKRGFMAFGASVCDIEISIYSHK